MGMGLTITRRRNYNFNLEDSKAKIHTRETKKKTNNERRTHVKMSAVKREKKTQYTESKR